MSENILVHSWNIYGCLQKLSGALYANINLYVMQRKTNHFRNEKENNTKPSTRGSKHHLWIMTVHQTYLWQVGINLNKLNNVFVMKCEISWMILINGWIGKEKTKHQQCRLFRTKLQSIVTKHNKLATSCEVKWNLYACRIDFQLCNEFIWGRLQFRFCSLLGFFTHASISNHDWWGANATWLTRVGQVHGSSWWRNYCASVTHFFLFYQFRLSWLLAGNDRLLNLCARAKGRFFSHCLILMQLHYSANLPRGNPTCSSEPSPAGWKSSAS